MRPSIIHDSLMTSLVLRAAYAGNYCCDVFKNTAVWSCPDLRTSHLYPASSGPHILSAFSSKTSSEPWSGDTNVPFAAGHQPLVQMNQILYKPTRLLTSQHLLSTFRASEAESELSSDSSRNTGGPGVLLTLEHDPDKTNGLSRAVFLLIYLCGFAWQLE